MWFKQMKKEVRRNQKKSLIVSHKQGDCTSWSGHQRAASSYYWIEERIDCGSSHLLPQQEGKVSKLHCIQPPGGKAGDLASVSSFEVCRSWNSTVWRVYYLLTKLLFFGCRKRFGSSSWTFQSLFLKKRADILCILVLGELLASSFRLGSAAAAAPN